MTDMLLASSSTGGAMGTVMMIVWCVVIFGFCNDSSTEKTGKETG